MDARCPHNNDPVTCPYCAIGEDPKISPDPAVTR